MMKQIFLTLLFSFITLTMAFRRSSPVPPVARNPEHPYGDIHRMGWGLDEEYVEPPNMEDIEKVKSVKNVVHDKKDKQHCDEEDTSNRRIPLLWGVTKISDFEDFMGLE